MRTIRISDEVYAEIAKKGDFGETENDVLERVFGLESKRPKHKRRRKNQSTNKMTPKFEGQELTLSFSNGLSKRWLLPNQDDKQSLAKIRAEMFDFAKQKNDATPGQLQAITKALNGAGYYITGPRSR